MFMTICLLGSLGCQKSGADKKTEEVANLLTKPATPKQGTAVPGIKGAQAKPAPAKPNVEKTAAADSSSALMDPAKVKLKAPASFKLKLETTKGDIIINVKREWTPNGVDRIYSLAKAGYYKDVAFFRVINNFMAQVGMSGDPKLNRVWRSATIPDDPVMQSNTRGMVTFAKTGAPNSRSTQFFINFKDNSFLDKMAFAPFGQVEPESMKVVDRLHAGYGEGAPRGRGPSQTRIMSEGNRYLKADFPLLDYIKSASVIE